MRALELTGQRFGQLLVIKRISSNKPNKNTMWLCRCDCGNEKETIGSYLVQGITKNCGCYRKRLVSERSTKEIAGNRYGKLVVIERATEIPSTKNSRKAWWLCKCDCGNTNIVDGSMLRAGKTKSCGCSKYLDEGEAAFNKLYYNYENSWRRSDSGKQRSNKARLVFEIPKEKFRELVSQNCYYCDATPSNTIKSTNGDCVYNGLDRIDNQKGYTLDNVVPCCGECNFYKGIKTQEEFISWIKRIANHWKDK